MTDPERLVDGDDLGADLLRSARTLDTKRARERKAALIGAAAISAVAATKATTTATTGTAAKGFLQGAFAKWLVITIGASAIGVGIVLGAAGGEGTVPAGARRLAPAFETVLLNSPQPSSPA